MPTVPSSIQSQQGMQTPPAGPAGFNTNLPFEITIVDETGKAPGFPQQSVQPTVLPPYTSVPPSFGFPMNGQPLQTIQEMTPPTATIPGFMGNLLAPLSTGISDGNQQILPGMSMLPPGCAGHSLSGMPVNSQQIGLPSFDRRFHPYTNPAYIPFPTPPGTGGLPTIDSPVFSNSSFTPNLISMTSGSFYSTVPMQHGSTSLPSLNFFEPPRQPNPRQELTISRQLEMAPISTAQESLLIPGKHASQIEKSEEKPRLRDLYSPIGQIKEKLPREASFFHVPEPTALQKLESLVGKGEREPRAPSENAEYASALAWHLVTVGGKQNVDDPRPIENGERMVQLTLLPQPSACQYFKPIVELPIRHQEFSERTVKFEVKEEAVDHPEVSVETNVESSLPEEINKDSAVTNPVDVFFEPSTRQLQPLIDKTVKEEIIETRIKIEVEEEIDRKDDIKEPVQVDGQSIEEIVQQHVEPEQLKNVVQPFIGPFGIQQLLSSVVERAGPEHSEIMQQLLSVVETRVEEKVFERIEPPAEAVKQSASCDIPMEPQNIASKAKKCPNCRIHGVDSSSKRCRSVNREGFRLCPYRNCLCSACYKIETKRAKENSDEESPYPMVISPADFRPNITAIRRSGGSICLKDSNWENYPNQSGYPVPFVNNFPQNSQFGQQFLTIQCPVPGSQVGMVQVITMPLNVPIPLIPQSTPVLQFCSEIIDQGSADKPERRTIPELPGLIPQYSHSLISPEIPQQKALPVSSQLTPLLTPETSHWNLRTRSLMSQVEEMKPSRRDLYSPISWVEEPCWVSQ